MKYDSEDFDFLLSQKNQSEIQSVCCYDAGNRGFFVEFLDSKSPTVSVKAPDEVPHRILQANRVYLV
jgi:hypothetical protein